MKKLFSATISRQINTKTQSIPFAWSVQPLFYFIILLVTFLFSACRKYGTNEPRNEEHTMTDKAVNIDAEWRTYSSELDPQTLGELKQARSATARYSNIANAFADGYENTAFLVMENMGYHFRKPQLIDAEFDFRKPEILVYNKKPNGNFELVAVEYAVPIDPQNPTTPPQGFTGDADKWDFNTLNSGLWTLHAWVWQSNPDGVFEMFNPQVIVR